MDDSKKYETYMVFGVIFVQFSTFLFYRKFWFFEISYIWGHIFALFMLPFSLNFPLRTLAQKQS